ncbi:RNA polymerase sigma factor SigW [Peribacillus castrilensis]|jgi:RNA polymerase sigma-70 factor (ECF subfamily)|uniref:RNA polymerase sigma factor n=3 Tax=Peribacillus TaxID=2675229 RepID=A0A9X8ZEB5_9BACI|nr:MULTISPECIES: RNA polymerase sigma factor SigW [Bacillaceae]KOR81403.1 RNA polymerase subunit sigma [Bacillus sp. FJAT-21352]KOR84912.1 RNA polymerase subunit sigma [Bacillus sp. FJAT-22058]KRF58832.1 RNA polymerase subunit sigma [Bacillus sp. Soil745]MBD8138242.1 RNA polymerase sigma factor SigW [Bacillus sp. CFBP 13597]MBL3645430.1 RNA polymerase sigma factor SigW [Bacillus sp. RHFB]MBT2602627.1 RNA polymerase sigma factor SigW [Bacillus sp. ISL-53]MCD1163528.1 RNA polymerase sigma fact
MDALIKERINQVLKGDHNAFGEIVEIYKDKVFQICFRMLGNRQEAEDLAQEAFVRAYVNIRSFNITMKFSTWLYRIATNLCIDRLRKKKPDYYLDAEVAGTEGLNMYSQIASDMAKPEEEVESLELQETIQVEIMKLPEKYRSVIVLKYIEELSLKEISEILDLPVGTVKTRIHRGREALRKQLRHL